MICRKCGLDNSENAAFCAGCGAGLQAEAVQNNEAAESDVSRNAAEGRYYSQGANYSASQAGQKLYSSGAGMPYNAYSPFENEKSVPSVKEYLKWLLLYPLINFVPGIGTILYIVICLKYAFDDSYKARANLFKATLITMLVSVVIVAAFFFAILAIAGFFMTAGFEVIDEIAPEIFNGEGFQHSFIFIR